MPFLTLEDPNVKIKGSRDPLGVQPVWSAFGRHVVSNLTTVSTSVRGFTILLLGRYYAADVIDRGMAKPEDALDIFLRAEQVGAYARYVGHDVSDDIRGIERVKRFVDENRGRVTIQTNRQGLILSDQKTYGLWGLFTVPARTSGMVPDGPVDVLPASRDLIVSEYAEYLGPAERQIRQILARGGWLDTRSGDAVFRAFSAVLTPEMSTTEHAFYCRYLRDGAEVEDAPPGRQERLRVLLEAHTDLDDRTGRAEVMKLARAAGRIDEGLAESLNRIAHLEAFLAPSDALFQFALMQHDQRRGAVAKQVANHWGARVPNLDRVAFNDLLPEVRERTNAAIASQMDRCHAALHGGDYGEAIDALVDWNQLVMNARGGAPWLRLGARQTLDVRYRGSDYELPGKDELPELWANTYFIDALKTVTRQLRT